MNEDKVKELAEKVERVLDLHERMQENNKKLLRMCLDHLTTHGKYTYSREGWDAHKKQKEQLIDALRKYVGETTDETTGEATPTNLTR